VHELFLLDKNQPAAPCLVHTTADRVRITDSGFSEATPAAGGAVAQLILGSSSTS
jgi:hypothetical protein